MGTGSNHLLVEVLCAFWFDPNHNNWDSTFFGKYYSLIEEGGYTIKQEQQGYEVKFELNDKEPPLAQTDKSELRMIFKNPGQNSAILMAPHYVSFHKLAPYLNWDTFWKEQINPFLERYKQIGLGKELLKVQVLYLNKYQFNAKANLSDTFKFLPALHGVGIGHEKSLLFQAQYEVGDNLVQTIRLNTNPEEERSFFFECNCIASNEGRSNDWLSLITQAHDTNNTVFENIVKK